MLVVYRIVENGCLTGDVLVTTTEHEKEELKSMDGDWNTKEWKRFVIDDKQSVLIGVDRRLYIG